MNIVLFLGAGFSHPFGLPVMNEFFDTARASSALSTDEKEFLETLQRRARNQSMLQISDDNLEDILSFALTAAGAPMPREDTGDTDYARLCVILVKLYGTLDHEKCLPLILGRRLGEVLGFRGGTWEHRVTIVTTNYDVTAEFALHQVGIPPSIPGNWSQMNKKAADSLYRPGDRSDATICKLHGSINWFLGTGDTLEIYGGLFYQDLRTSDGDHETRLCPVMSFEPDTKIPGVPLIVPPTFFKTRFEELLAPMWRRAEVALSQADLLAFVGYSFPDSDTHMQYFLARALADNVKLRQILVVDPRAKSLVQKLKDSKFGHNFTRRLAAVPNKWHYPSFRIVPDSG